MLQFWILHRFSICACACVTVSVHITAAVHKRDTAVNTKQHTRTYTYIRTDTSAYVKEERMFMLSSGAEKNSVSE